MESRQPKPSPKDGDKVAKRQIKPSANPRQVEQPTVQKFNEEPFGQSVIFEQSHAYV